MQKKYEDGSNSRKLEGAENLNPVAAAPLTQHRSDLRFFDGVFTKEKDQDKKYHFKVKPIESAQFESYCATIHRFIVTEKYVPSYKAYKGSTSATEAWIEGIISTANRISNSPQDVFDHLAQYVSERSELAKAPTHGVASKIIDFVSNSAAPLREKDLIMECYPFYDEFILARIKRTLIGTIDVLEGALQKPFIPQRVKNFFSPPNEYYQLKFCKNTLDSLDFYDTQMLDGLKNNSLCPQNLQSLLASWIDHRTSEGILELSIPLFERLDTKYSSEVLGDELHVSFNGDNHLVPSKLLEQYRLIKGLGRTLIMRSVFNDWDENNTNFSKNGQMIDFEYSKMNVLMSGPFWYSYHKLFTSILENNGIITDAIDDEEAIRGILSTGLYQDARKFLGFESLKWNSNLISNFPDIGEAGQFVHYHPTKRLFFSRVLFGLVTNFLIDCQNNSDKETVQSISKAITKFFPALNDTQSSSLEMLMDTCYIGFLALKGALSGECLNDLIEREQSRYIFTKLHDIWHDFYEQHQTKFEWAENIVLKQLGSQSKTYSKEDNEVYKLLSCHPVFIYHKNISLLKYILTSREQYDAMAKLHLCDVRTQTSLVDDEELSIKNLKTILIHTEQFQQFIIDDGNEAMEIILQEFSETKFKYQNKLDTKPHYNQFVNSIDLDSIKEEYSDIYSLVYNLYLEKSEDEEYDFVL